MGSLRDASRGRSPLCGGPSNASFSNLVDATARAAKEKEMDAKKKLNLQIAQSKAVKWLSFAQNEALRLQPMIQDAKRVAALQAMRSRSRQASSELTTTCTPCQNESLSILCGPITADCEDKCICASIHHTEVQVTLQWFGKANCVQVVFDIDGWTVAHSMTQSMDGVWTFDRFCQNHKPIEFKFIVDGIWSTSSNYPTTLNNNNTNNTIFPVLMEYRPHNTTTTQVSFCSNQDNWASQTPLQFCSHESKFFGVLLLRPLREVQFKFVVNGEWLCCADYPRTTTVDGYENNFMSFNFC